MDIPNTGSAEDVPAAWRFVLRGHESKLANLVLNDPTSTPRERFLAGRMRKDKTRFVPEDLQNG